MNAVNGVTKPPFNPLDYDPTEPIYGLILIFKVCGVWPMNYKFRNLYLLYGTLFQFIFVFAFCGFKLLNFYFKTNMDQVTVIVFECIAEISLWVRAINFVMYFDPIMDCLDTIKSFRCRTQVELKFYKKELKMFSIVMRFYAGCASFACLFSLGAPYFSDKPMLPYPAWYPLDWENNRLHFWIAYVYQFVGILILAHLLVLMEAFHIYLLISIGTQIDVLSHRFKNIGNRDLELPQKEGDAETIAYFVENIKIFEKISGVIDQVESLFNIQFFYQFICSAIIFCVTAFKILTICHTTIRRKEDLLKQDLPEQDLLLLKQDLLDRNRKEDLPNQDLLKQDLVEQNLLELFDNTRSVKAKQPKLC